MTPDVTVIIPAYNSMPYITETLDSVFAQTLGMDRIELIVVDDGSTDGTDRELARVASERPGMTVIRQENSGGPARPRNVALDRATGRYVFFLDADDLLNTECLERMVRCADEQGSDVVLGKLLGGGGRRPPKAMFTSTQLSANVFDSRVWWALNVLKLFRREFIERHGLRFREDLFSEDQPFTGTAYLKAEVISVLADYDYVTFMWRDDMGNMTLADIPLDRLMNALRVMIDLIVDSVDAGPNRDHLLKRHFEVEYFKIFRAMARASDRAAVETTFSQLREWALAHFPYSVVQDLPPMHRVAHSLLLRGDLERLLAFVGRYMENPDWEVSVEGDRVYARFPESLGVDTDVPEQCFDVTPLIKVRHELITVEWRDEILSIEGRAYLDLFECGEVEARLVLRERTTDVEFSLPVGRSGSPGHTTTFWQRSCAHEDAGISAEIDPLTAADGQRLPNGIWDVLLRLSTQGITREARIGRVKSPDIDATFRWRLLPAGAPSGIVVGSYFTAGFGNLSLDVGGSQRAGTPWISADRVAWEPNRGGALALSGISHVIGLDLAQALTVVARDEVGNEFPARTTFDSDSFVAHIDVTDAAARGGLRPGKWAIALSARAGSAQAELMPKARESLKPSWVWISMWPHRVSVSAPGAQLAMHVRPLSLALVKRGLSRSRAR